MEEAEGEVKRISDEDVVGYLLGQLGLQNQVMEDRMVKKRKGGFGVRLWGGG